MLAEAGTGGIGKTLGYVAPASLWAERNGGTVWLSTFTRNLQRQLDQELDRLYPDPDTKKRRVVIRKGRENYLCLLSYEEAVNRLTIQPHDAVALGLIARWAGATRGGDMIGGDLPGWLAEIVGREKTLGLTDRRGESHLRRLLAALPEMLHRAHGALRASRRDRGREPRACDGAGGPGRP